MHEEKEDFDYVVVNLDPNHATIQNWLKHTRKCLPKSGKLKQKDHVGINVTHHLPKGEYICIVYTVYEGYVECEALVTPRTYERIFGT